MTEDHIIYLLASAFVLGIIAALLPGKPERNGFVVGLVNLLVVTLITVVGWSLYGFLANYEVSELNLHLVVGGMLYGGIGMAIFSFFPAVAGYLLAFTLKQFAR